MEEETIDQIETTARLFATTVVMVTGANSIFDAMETQWGLWATFASMCSVLVVWQSRLLRSALKNHSAWFVALLTTSAVVMVLSFLACLPGSRA